MHGWQGFGGKNETVEVKLLKVFSVGFHQLTCWPVTSRMEPSLACTTCRKTWSRMRSSLQQFCSSFIWSSTWLKTHTKNKHQGFCFSFLSYTAGTTVPVCVIERHIHSNKPVTTADCMSVTVPFIV